MRSKAIPADAEVLRTYDELREFRNAFFKGEFYFLLLVGRHGLSKSWEFEERCKPQKDRDGQEVCVAHYIKGNITPVVAYQEAYRHLHKLLILDDAERLWADTHGRYLLRDLTECKPRKVVHWQAENKDLDRAGIPKFFETSSRVALIMNRFAFGDAHEYDAIVDRAQFIYFDPTPLEIHKNAALWFWDQEVYDYVTDHLSLMDPNKLSARTYVKAYERKPKGDWREFIDRRYCKQSGEQLVAALESDPKYQTVKERAAEFMKRTGLTRATYFNCKKALKADEQLQPLDVPRFTLTAKPPNAPNLEEEVKAAAERERRRAEQTQIEQQEEQEYRDLDDKYFGDKDEDEDDDE
jgi:hypothetical protein